MIRRRSALMTNMTETRFQMPKPWQSIQLLPIGDKADMGQFLLAELFELKVKISEVIMLGGHNNSMHLAVENQTYLTKSRLFRDDPLFGLERNQIKNNDI